MSNPPYPPSNPGNGTSPGNGSPEEPQYGERTPQYGPPAPQPGQPAAPQYGQQAPQYGQQPSPYGQQPSPYAQQNVWPSQQPAPAGVPRLVNISFWLILAAGLLTLIGIPFASATLNSPEGRSMIEEALAAQGGDAAGVDADSLISIAVTVFIVISVIFAGLYALVAFGVRKGKNWARILGTVFAAISLLGLSQPGVGTISILLGIAAIVLLYLPASAPYFRKAQPFANPYNQPGNPYGR